MSGTSPSSWDQLEALIGQPETSQLDFKEGLIANPKIAKAAAAMSVAGGEVIFGVAQDKDTGLATALAPIAEVARAEERISQVLADGVDPTPQFSIEVIRDPTDPSRGVILLRVPRSESGPHEVDGRFPVRRGTTTDYLNSAEVAAIFRDRERPQPRPSDLFEDAALLPGISEARVRSVYAGFGQLRVAARPRDATLEHPSSPWLADPLAAAARAARARAEERLAIYAPTLLLPKLEAWEPAGTSGWVAGRAGQSIEGLVQRPSVAAILAYRWRTLIQVTIPTVVPAEGEGPPYLCAHEGRIATELWGALAFVGELYAADAAVQLDVAIHIAGFSEAVSYHASGAEAGLPVKHLPRATHGDLRLVTVNSEELRGHPEATARKLIEHWLVPFYEGGDLLDYVTVPQDLGTPLS